MTPRAYLAGPDVFLADAVAVGRAKAEVCAAAGLEGVFPLGGGSGEPIVDPWPLYARLVETMESCDLVLANMSPFRGPSMDVGTAFEMGWFAARGRPVFGYTSTPAPYDQRVDADGHEIEGFGLTDNLMMCGAVHVSGAEVVCVEGPDGEGLAAMAAFRRCVEVAAASLAGR